MPRLNLDLEMQDNLPGFLVNHNKTLYLEASNNKRTILHLVEDLVNSNSSNNNKTNKEGIPTRSNRSTSKQSLRTILFTIPK